MNDSLEELAARVKAEPNNPEILKELGNLYFRLGESLCQNLRVALRQVNDTAMAVILPCAREVSYQRFHDVLPRSFAR